MGQTPLRVATYDVDFFRKGPGILLRDILRESSDDANAALGVIAHVNPDILLLTGIDYDLSNVTVRAFADALAGGGADYPHVFAALPNSGMASGLDLNGDGRLGSARDAQGYGRYAGANGMAVLSRYPIQDAGFRDFSDLLWKDFPQADLPQIDGAPFPSQTAQDSQRLSTTGHWDLPITTPDGLLHLFAYSATPPVFDGPEDMNGKRSADETRFWGAYLDGALARPAPSGPFVILGNSNLDPVDGDGIKGVMQTLLDHPRVFDPHPSSLGGKAASDPSHLGDPALDTADWPGDGSSPGNLRVDYVLPSSDITVVGSGVFWPQEGTPEAALLAEGEGITRHRLVWVDITLP
ncbi:endonuclease/exonuclease/phosphatase family protein [Falsihalocynthiibacter sp. BN13B15]|uniref:endonuclease/exonuclease/phosphatase family protein n=1 Tax=Falsihalocynthiibacter sp. BN13B15 TaxID=3240871 RepID=UPI00350EE25C